MGGKFALTTQTAGDQYGAVDELTPPPSTAVLEEIVQLFSVPTEAPPPFPVVQFCARVQLYNVP